MTDDALARQTRAEITHWRLAIESLADLDTVAAPEAWAAMEAYLQRSVRDRLRGVVTAVALDARALERRATAGADTDELRRGVLWLRRRFL